MVNLHKKHEPPGYVSISSKKINKKRLKKVLTMVVVDDKLLLLNTKVLSKVQ